MLLNIKSTLRVGDTLVPFIVMSQGTNLSNLAGKTIVWPVYMTIGNLSSQICQLIPENSGNLDPILKFLQVGNTPAAVPLDGFSVGNILVWVHVIPEMATGIKTGDRPNER